MQLLQRRRGSARAGHGSTFLAQREIARLQGFEIKTFHRATSKLFHKSITVFSNCLGNTLHEAFAFSGDQLQVGLVTCKRNNGTRGG